MYVSLAAIFVLSCVANAMAACNCASISPTTTVLLGAGTVTDPKQICTVPQFNAIGTTFGRQQYFILCQSLNFTGKPLVQVGSPSKPFSGDFDGNRKTISGYSVNQVSYASGAPVSEYIGLFRATVGASIHDFQIKNVRLSVFDAAGNLLSYQRYAAAFIGKVDSLTYPNGTVIPTKIWNMDVSVDMNIPGDYYAGVFSDLNGAQVTNCNFRINFGSSFGNDDVAGVARRTDLSTFKNVNIFGTFTYVTDPAYFGDFNSYNSLGFAEFYRSTFDGGSVSMNIDLPAFAFDEPNGLGGLAATAWQSSFSNIILTGKMRIGGVPYNTLYGNSTHSIGIIVGADSTSSYTNVVSFVNL